MSTSSPACCEAPVRIIEPRRGWLSVNWAELWSYRELLYFLAWRDVKVRYKQTVIGVLWAFIQPFLKLVVFSVIFGHYAQMDSEGYPYPVFLYAGLLPWQFFQETLSRSSTSVVASSALITKVYFPRLLIPMATVGATLLDFAIAFSILFGLMLYYGVAFTPALFGLLPLVLFTIFTALGFGFFFGALNVAYRDFRYVMPFVVQLGLFLTPVIYPVRMLPEAWRWVLCLNPMAGLIDAYRAAVLARAVAWDYLGISMAVAVVVGVFGLYFFRRLERRFADII